MRRIAFVACAAALFACGIGGKKKQGKSGGGDKPAAAPTGQQAAPPAAAPAPNPMAAFGMVSEIIKGVKEPGPYDEPRASKGFDDDKDHVDVIELAGEVNELEAFSWFGGESLELRALTDRLRELSDDPHVVGLLLRVGDLSIDLASAQELRPALLAFKTAGGRQRKLWCHTEGAADTVYYLLTACDRIGVAPTGDVLISGVAAMPIHIKGLLDKLGIRADIVHVGAFKGAGEPVTRDAPSPEMMETLGAILDNAYATLLSGLVEGRHLDADKAKALVDRAVFLGDDAVASGLIDEVSVFEKFRDTMAGDAGWHSIKVSEEEEPGFGKLMEFLGAKPLSRPHGAHVALVYAVGSVVDGKGEGILGAREQIASRPLTSAFRALAADDSVKAIVLRIDSGGGSALASEQIWQAVAEAKAKKPVVVSMGRVAASGGYYIACGATKIYAEPDTLTGSIGVVGGKLAIAGALEKVGVRAFPVGRGKHALMWRSFDGWNADEKQIVQQMMEGVYKTFVTRVSDGRGKTYAAIDAIAQGRVWTGAAAKERGLVDDLGGLDAALADARKLGGVAEGAGIEVYPPEPTLRDILSSFGQVSAPIGLDARAAELLRDLPWRERRALGNLFGQLLLLRDTPVLAVAFDSTVFSF